MKTKPNTCYGGTGCGICECTGRIKNKDIWIYARTQQIVKLYEKKFKSYAQHYKMEEKGAG